MGLFKKRVHQKLGDDVSDKAEAAGCAIRAMADSVNALGTATAGRTSSNLYSLASDIEHGSKFEIARSAVHAIRDLSNVYSETRDMNPVTTEQAITEIVAAARKAPEVLDKIKKIESQLDPDLVKAFKEKAAPLVEEITQQKNEQAQQELAQSQDQDKGRDGPAVGRLIDF